MPGLAKNTMTDTIIHARALRKSYRRGSSVTAVLSGVDLDIERGQCVFFVGPSGSGKSTLLSILGCILTPDEGTLNILGWDLSSLSDQARIRLRRDVIGFVFQRFQLIRGLSVLENVMVPLQLQGKPLHASYQRVRSLLDAVGLSEHLHAKPRNLSAGQCQRVAMARALAADPQIILADEPTASLDATTGNEIMRLLHDLIAQYNKTAIVVTHDQRIFKYADRICHLEKGVLTQHS